jgi:5-methylcytosine-specific restriction endonuclease McrA
MKTTIKIKRRVKKTVKKAVGLEKDKPRKNFSVKTKAEIRKFQRGYCAFPGCSNKKRLAYDHIRGRDDNSFENCQLLCEDHHRLKSDNDKAKQKIGKRLRKEGFS